MYVWGEGECVGEGLLIYLLAVNCRQIASVTEISSFKW